MRDILRQRIGVRMTLAMASILAVLLIGGLAWLNDQLNDLLKDLETRQAATHADTLVSTLRTLMLNGEGTLAHEWLEDMRGANGVVDIEVLRRDGQPAFTDLDTVEAVNEFLGAQVFSREPVTFERVTPVDERSYEQALQGETSTDWSRPGEVSFYLPIETDLQCLACHGYESESLRGVLRLALSTEEMDRWAEELQRGLFLGLVILLVVLSAFQWLIVRQGVLVPLTRLKNSILGTENDGLGPPLDLHREDEVGEVAAVFDRIHRQLRAVTDNVPDAILTHDSAGRILTANQAVDRLFGYKPPELQGREIGILLAEAQREVFQAHFGQCLADGTPDPGLSWETLVQHRDGTIIPVEISLNEYHLQGARRFIAVIRDITERKAQTALIEHQALHDALTDLPNRILLADRLQHAIRQAKRNHETLALMIMDLDRFKEINDTFGHMQGDLLLQQIAARLGQMMRGSDTMARLGGDEFAVLLPQANLEMAVQFANRLLSAFEEPYVLQDRPYVLGTSIGIALYPLHGSDEATLLQHADTAMYAAKRARTGFVIYDVQQSHFSEQSLNLVSDLRKAVAEEQMVLHYQPKVDLKTRCVAGVEALIRWRHPHYGLIPPSDFIPLAEQHGLTRPLALWVLRESLRLTSRWRQQGIDLNISMNLSMNDLEDEHFSGKVAELLEPGNLNHYGLCLEVTETTMMSNSPGVIKTINALSGMGFEVSIDDFGIGYSSLTNLRQLPLSEVKIDKSFVMDMIDNKEAETIVCAVIDLAHNLGLQVVAEGVCNQAIYDRLSMSGCDVAQGYFIARPMDEAALSEWLRSSPWRKS